MSKEDLNNTNPMPEKVDVDEADSDATDATEDFSDFPAPKLKNALLETSLEHLTTVYKKVLRDNSVLKYQLVATEERVKSLEAALRETNKGYLGALDRIGRAVSNKVHDIPPEIPGAGVGSALQMDGEGTEKDAGDH